MVVLDAAPIPLRRKNPSKTPPFPQTVLSPKKISEKFLER